MRIVSLVTLLSALAVVGCSEEAPKEEPSATATTPPATTAKPTASTSSAPPPSDTPRSDCPKDSAGPGTLEKPCIGKGPTRMMTAEWRGKYDDKGSPYIHVKNVSPKPILYGKIALFFYDKAGKQIQVQVDGAPAPFKICSGKIFQGVMKENESAKLTFSCFRKEDLPANVAAIEAELSLVGFADAGGTNVEYYWSNRDLTPDERPKGGIKK